MKQPINEIKRMQQLAGVLKESAGGPLDFSSGELPIKTPKEGETYLKNLKVGDKFSIGTNNYIVLNHGGESGVSVSYSDGTGHMRFREDAIVNFNNSIDEQTAFERGAPEEEYDLQDCLFEIAYNCDIAKKSENPGDYLSTIIYFAELAKTKI